jgi:hypothetical protein
MVSLIGLQEATPIMAIVTQISSILAFFIRHLILLRAPLFLTEILLISYLIFDYKRKSPAAQHVRSGAVIAGFPQIAV